MGSTPLDWPAYHQVQSFLHAEARMLDDDSFEARWRARVSTE